ncbi:MAG: hypothetical protein WC343_02605, partial [Bacilli bacterium]
WGSLARLDDSPRSRRGDTAGGTSFEGVGIAPGGSVALSGRGAFLIGALHCGTFTNKIDPGSGY